MKPVKISGVEFDPTTARLLDSFASPAAEVLQDLALLRAGESRGSLLALCLDGAPESDGPAWRDYVDTLCAHVEAHGGPRPSGPTQTNEARRQAGRVRVSVWLTAEDAERLNAACRRSGRNRSAQLAAMVGKLP